MGWLRPLLDLFGKLFGWWQAKEPERRTRRAEATRQDTRDEVARGDAAAVSARLDRLRGKTRGGVRARGERDGKG